MSAFLARTRKATVAGLAAGAVALWAARSGGVTAAEFGQAAAYAYTAWLTAWAVPNAPKAP